MTKFILITAILFLALPAFAADVKVADLAGSWYPADKTELSALIEGYLDAAGPEKVDGNVFAIISPHAGYQFSGPVAAYGFKAVKGSGVKTVIVVGFSHRKAFDGISVYSKGAFRTPIGEIKIDEKLADDIISKSERIRFSPALFDGENSVEMQIPFIQSVFKDARIVPVAFGTQDYSDARILAESLAAVLKDRSDVLVVASTDLSHYHPYTEAGLIDKRLIEAFNKMGGRDFYDAARIGSYELCGLMPVTATLLAAEMLGFDKIKVLKYANSGDTYGDKTKVVGYLSAAIYKNRAQSTEYRVQDAKEREGEKRMLNEAQRKRLLQIARESITSYVRDGKRKQFTEKDPLLNQPMGAFVTLHEDGELRGCIGKMQGAGALYQTVAGMAVESAAGDPRFRPLSPREIEKIDIEISVLSPMKRVSSYKEVNIPGDGVMVRKGLGGGVYLPQVATEAGWNREEFLTSLCGQKAGIAPDAWKDPDTELYTFTAEVFGEKDIKR